VRSRLGRLGRRLSPLYLIIALILGSAVALGVYSYRNARQLLSQGERSLAESNRLLGEQALLRIDNFIIDSDRSHFDLVDLAHLQDFQRRWGEIVRLSEAIEAAVVLDDQYEVLHNGYVSKKSRTEAERFARLFRERILPELPLADLKVDLHKHLHAVIDGHDYLISYIKREQQGPDGMVRRYVVVLKVNLEYLERKFFPEVFSKLQGRVEFAVVDDRNQVVFGQQPRAAAEFLYSAYFPTTLYLWRLEMAPPEAARLSAEARARRVSETTLVILMVATILVGLSFLIYAIIKEQRANQLKSDFISNVSHELKTPLSLIRMFGELIALGKLKSPEKGKEYAEIITREAERLSRLIDNVLDFARIERGKAAYDFQPGDLGEVVARSVDVYRHREGVKLTVSIDEEIPLTLIDENAMTLVLLNLLDNAVKYGGDKPEIGVTLRCLPQEGLLRLEVSDRGPGIPRDEQRRIFDRFYRARAARTRNTRGSGIGLSLVKHIAESHGGRVTVDSDLGSGAIFTVTIPLRPAPEAVPAVEAA
jgi:two-component system phosphate regulon sensor histidine kinase PhoR